MNFFTKTYLIKPLSAAAFASLAMMGTMSGAESNEARQETSDRSPAKETLKPLSQVDSAKGVTSDRTPGTTAAATPETSDRTPAKATETPAPQAGKFRDDTSDRTPSNE
jgi:hypothetical protein